MCAYSYSYIWLKVVNLLSSSSSSSSSRELLAAAAAADGGRCDLNERNSSTIRVSHAQNVKIIIIKIMIIFKSRLTSASCGFISTVCVCVSLL